MTITEDFHQPSHCLVCAWWGIVLSNYYFLYLIGLGLVQNSISISRST